MAKLGSIAVADTSKLHLRSADDEPLFYEADDGQGGVRREPATAMLFGPGSKPYKTATAAAANRIADKFQRKGKFRQSAEERESEEIDKLVACTIAIEGLEFDGEYERLSRLSGPDLYRAIYSEPALGFIKDQVKQHIDDWANFTKS